MSWQAVITGHCHTKEAEAHVIRAIKAAVDEIETHAVAVTSTMTAATHHRPGDLAAAAAEAETTLAAPAPTVPVDGPPASNITPAEAPEAPAQ